MIESAAAGGLIVLLSAALLVWCFVRFNVKKRFTKDKKGSKYKSPVDLKVVERLGQAYTEKVEEDEKELLQNEEENSSVKKKKKCLGSIKYKVEYDFITSNLNVTVIEAKDLPAMDLGGTSDPYVKVYLLPDKNKKFETKVHRKTLDPVFNESFKFNVPYGDVMGKTLVFAVFDFDRFTKNDEIGEVRVPVCNIDLAYSEEKWQEIKSTSGDGHLGEICFSLRYVPTTGKLTVLVMECKNLKKMDVGGLSDPYVKISLMQNGKRLRKKKTSIKKFTLNPYYNESLTFDVPFEWIQSVSLLVTVVDYDRVGGNEPIGCVEVGCNSTKAELKHWSEMLANPRRPIAKWHTLKPMAVEKSRLERLLPKRGNLSKALSVDADNARHAILKLKKTKSVDDRSRTVSLSVVSESSESTGDLSNVLGLGSQASGLQDLGHVDRES